MAATPSITPPGGSTPFAFPPHYSFPPFFTLQPNTTTLTRQLSLWSSLIQSYCAHNRIFRLSLTETQDSAPLCNPSISRRLDLRSAQRVIDYMISLEGGKRAEWCGSGRKDEASRSAAWIYWRRPEEWADMVYAWVDGTGQRGSVLTFYELRVDEEGGRREWTGMDEDMFRRCLEVLVKRGKAQIFGAEDGAGVKFS